MNSCAKWQDIWDWDSLYAATLASIRNPIGMPPLKELAGPGKSVVIVIPDIVKGGNQPTSHRKVAIRACLDELYAAGVEQKDVLLLFSNGLHPRATVAEMQTILGPELFGEFYPTGQITSHDSEDYDHLVDLGYTAQGDHVIMNKYVYDADVAVLIGHTQGNPYGGYSGGYKHCATGISHWRSISAHHVPQVMHRQDFVPVSTNSEMRHKFDQQGMRMEEKMGKKFFCCDAVLDTRSRQIEITSGWAREMQPVSWKMADKRTYVHWAEKKYDIIVFGMPTNFHYGNGMGTNPIQMMQALSAQVIRHRRIMSDRCVFIVSSICDGYFHDERWPYLRELYDLFQHDYMNILPDMNRYGEYFATKEEYIRKYRFANAFHPFHGFSMMSCGHLAEEHTSAIYIVGAREPGIARGMGLKTRATFEEALADAMRKYTGPNPNILALPRTFTTAAVHAADPTNPEVWKGIECILPTGTTLQYMFLSYLQSLGLSADDVTITNMDVTPALTAFNAGEGDALCVWNAVAYNAEDSGLVRITDVSELGINNVCGLAATKDAMENKSDLIDLAWMVYYLTWDWCQQSEDNMAQAVELYVESCEDEGVVSNESICQRALDIFACPSPSEAVSVMTTEEEDRLSLADRPLLAAENDLLETMDFFISIGSYTEEDRTAILDKELVNSSVAERCAETLKTLGYLE